jgi:D-alanine-D-alanine ligase
MPKQKIKIAILCGGIGSEHEVSLKSGAQVLVNLSKEKYLPELIEITREGKWLLHEENNTTKLVSPPILAPERPERRRWDIVFIALHGTFGEDGRIQALLDLAGIPYTSSGVLASALGMDKAKTKRLVAQSGVRCPKFLELHTVFSPDNVHKQILKTVKYPCVVKPNSSGSSVGVSIVKTKKELPVALEKAQKEDGVILVEEYIKGREVTCGVMGNSNHDKLVPMPPVEIVVDGRFFDYHAKYESKVTKEICPAKLSKQLTKKLQELAMKAHEALGCDGLTRSDFIIKGSTPYFLEINTIPGLTEQSLCPKEAKAMGMSFGELLDKMVEMGLKKIK